MSNQHSVTKRHRRPKSEKRADYTARDHGGCEATRTSSEAKS